MSAASVSSRVPAGRCRPLTYRPVRPDGAFVLYWMTAFRRLEWNFALERAVELARQTGRPLVILEGLRADYPWASERIHRFVLDGMRVHARQLDGGSATYYPFVEPAPGAGHGLLGALAGHAVAIVADDWPGFFHPRMLEAVSGLECHVEAVDASGLLPVRASDRAFPSAYAFRRFLQRVLPEHLAHLPAAEPLASLTGPRAQLPADVLERWRPTPVEELDRGIRGLRFPTDVAPAETEGGRDAGLRRLDRFIAARLDRYADERNVPDDDVASGLSPYLHFGHVSPHEVLARLADREGWTPDRVSSRASGKREGWWGMDRSAEAFLDQLVTWRELGLNAAVHLPHYERYESLPGWAQETLEVHAADRRQWTYSVEELAEASTHDPLWNAAQTQLRQDGTIHNYLRMLWGKKILEWSPSPRVAAEAMIELNNRYALDGRDPNSYSGIFWCLGRYDRPWGPERRIFGKIRYMTSANTARKFPVGEYLARYGQG